MVAGNETMAGKECMILSSPDRIYGINQKEFPNIQIHGLELIEDCEESPWKESHQSRTVFGSGVFSYFVVF